MEIRRQLTIEEETLIEGGKSLHQPIKKVAAIVVITNPLAMTTGGRPHARIPGGVTKDEIG